MAQEDRIDEKDRLRRAEMLVRMNAARSFPRNTTGASRHVEIMAEVLGDSDVYHMFVEDPRHAAESMISVLTGFYEMRNLIDALKSGDLVKPLVWTELQDGYWARTVLANGKVVEIRKDGNEAEAMARAERDNVAAAMAVLDIPKAV